MISWILVVVLASGDVEERGAYPTIAQCFAAGYQTGHEVMCVSRGPAKEFDAATDWEPWVKKAEENE